MDQYPLILVIVGLGMLAMAWMPALTEKLRVSYSVIYVAAGIIIYWLIDDLPAPDPVASQDITVHLTELVVIISLMGTGLKIDQKFGFKAWRVPLRLISLTMLLSIAGMMALCVFVLGFDPAVALLTGAVLAPTDPVMATDVQVEAPNEGEPDNVKFSLTAEAGLNDGVAFPFVWLAITWVCINSGLGGSFTAWVLDDVFYKLAVGVASGYLLGILVAYLIFGLPKQKQALVTRDGFVSIAATIMVYGATELIHGYGFIAVFIAGLAIRNYERTHKFHKRLHEFSEQIERILVAIMLILFGGCLVGGILDHLTWQMAIIGLVFLFVVRPVVAFVSLARTGLHKKEKLLISFFGIRGVGSAYYLAFAYSVAPFELERETWSLVAFIVLVSIVIHGSTAIISFKKLEKNPPPDSPVIAK